MLLLLDSISAVHQPGLRIPRVSCIDTARIDAEVQRVPPARPGQVIVDLPLRDLAPLRKGIVEAADGGKGHAVAARGKHDGKLLLDLCVVVRLEDTR